MTEVKPEKTALGRVKTIGFYIIAFLFFFGLLGTMYLGFVAMGKKPPRPHLEMDAMMASKKLSKPTGILVMRGLNRGEVNVLYQKVWPETYPVEHAFGLGGMVEPWIAQMCMALFDQGKMDFEASASQYLKNAGDPFASATVDQLLRHSAGIKDLEAANASLAHNPQHFKTLSNVIQGITGKPTPLAIQETIISALEMKATFFQMPTEPQEGFDGQWVTTLEDLSIWARFLNSNRIVSFDTHLKAHTPPKLSDGKRWPYGFAWSITPWNGYRIERSKIRGGGINVAFARLPQKNFFVAVLSEESPETLNAEALAEEIATMYLHREFPRAYRVKRKQADP